MNCDLQGLNVLVTRPKNQADRLSEMISEAHGRPVRFSAMDIQPLITKGSQRLLQQADQFDLIIFISANAVIHAFRYLPDILPATTKIAAIGKATARLLADKGLPVDLVPEKGFNSEALLALPELVQMQNKQVLIIRGQGGRESLKQSLEQRGARVHYAEVYKRSLPQKSAANLVQSWSDLVDVVTVTSVQIFENLWQLLGKAGQQKLQQTPLLVFSQRIAEQAKQRGCQQVIVTESADDESMLQALCRFRAGEQGK